MSTLIQIVIAPSKECGQISRLIISLWALIASNAWGKKPMLAIEELELKELESKYKHYEYKKH